MRRNRQNNNNRCALPGLGCECELALMEFDDPAGQGQPKAETVAGPGVGCPVEWMEHPLDILACDAVASVGDGYPNLRWVHFQANHGLVIV